MQINVIAFGQLGDLISENLVLENIADTDSLMATLYNIYPALRESKFMIAVNKKLINVNTLLADKSTIALLPAFSGG
jgi:molybdopterin synthase sulfur carrier subunit